MSELKVNKISPRSGTDITLGDSADTITIPSGATLDASNATVNFTQQASVTDAAIRSDDAASQQVLKYHEVLVLDNYSSSTWYR
jgi:hypothetical protein